MTYLTHPNPVPTLYKVTLRRAARGAGCSRCAMSASATSWPPAASPRSRRCWPRRATRCAATRARCPRGPRPHAHCTNAFYEPQCNLCAQAMDCKLLRTAVLADAVKCARASDAARPCWVGKMEEIPERRPRRRRRQALQVLAQLPEAAAPMAAAGLPAYIHAGNLRRPAHALRPATAPPALAAQVDTASDRSMPPGLSLVPALGGLVQL